MNAFGGWYALGAAMRKFMPSVVEAIIREFEVLLSAVTQGWEEDDE